MVYVLVEVLFGIHNEDFNLILVSASTTQKML